MRYNQSVMTTYKTEAKKGDSEYYVSPGSLWLLYVKRYVKLNLHKTYGEVSVNHRLFKRLSGIKNDSFARFASLLIVFAGKDDMVSELGESDLAMMTGVTLSAVKKYIKTYKNRLFIVLPADHNRSVQEFIHGQSKNIECNSYLMLEDYFAGFKQDSPIAVNEKQVRFKFKYKDLRSENYFLAIYKNFTSKVLVDPKTGAYITVDINAHDVENQNYKPVVFEHFHNPIYSDGFDPEIPPYPENWYDYKGLHPDIKPRFTKGRWYGNIHNIPKEDRKKYLTPLGITRELDLHNAMPYFMNALLPDSVSVKDKAKHLELTRSGVLYDEAVKYHTIEMKMPGETLDETIVVGVIAPSREEIKEGFQRYRNRAGKLKEEVASIDAFYRDKFPTIREWLLGVKGKRGLMQNRLAWVETDFMSYLCERLSAENIQLAWLHDAVYVSDESYDRAFEIRESLLDEFERSFK